MRIAYHNPWINAAENQAYMSMAEAARRIGIELIACADETDIRAAAPDFVLSVASSLAKIVDIPTYLTVHEPKAYLFERKQRLRNLFSYDGYLTVSDSLARFIRDFCAGIGRVEEPGFCYTTPQISDLRASWNTEALRVVYFGTNWDRRMPSLFRALDPTGILRIHGPEAAWRDEGLASYAGPVPFDGVGPQRIYAECGIGLALMDEKWRQEDVISNRIFEISSVGAVSICPDMPWTRKWFADSVLYFEPDLPVPEIAAQIKAHHAFCRANPDRARSMGSEARRIFETHFAAEHMLANAVAYHTRKTAERAALLAAMPPAPQISVILRCGGRDPATLRRAIESIARQTYGRFTVILAKYNDIAVPTDPAGAITAYDEFLIPGGGRAEMLFAAASRLATPYFAVLDDDDFWLSDHIESVFRAGLRVRPDFDVAFSGSIGFDFPIKFSETLSISRNILRFGYDPALADSIDVQNAIGTNTFVARSDLLSPEMLQTPAMNTAEDSLLISLIAWRSKPIFSYRPTAFYRRDAADGSNWQSDPQRIEDEISFSLRAGLAFSPHWLAADSFATPKRMWSEARVKLATKHIGEILDRLTIGAAGRWSREGIAAIPGTQGHIFYGPYLSLAPGQYNAVFLIAADPQATEPPAIVEICSNALDRILVQQELQAGTTELAIPFAVTPDMGDPRIEFRIFSRGAHAFTVTSVAVYRDAGVQAPAPPPEPPEPPQPSADEIKADIDAIRASASWRVTAPLRRLADLVRRQP